MRPSIGAVIIIYLALAGTAAPCFAQSGAPAAKTTAPQAAATKQATEDRVDTSIPETTQQYDGCKL